MAQGKGKTIPQAVEQIGVTEQTFYRWRKEYGGMRVDQASDYWFGAIGLRFDDGVFSTVPTLP